MTLLFLGIALGLSLAAGRSIWKAEEETRVRCWRCRATFSDQRGLVWHELGSHPFDDSEVLKRKDDVYR